MPDHVNRHSRLVGILGGMGPRATVDFYDKLVRLTPASRDQDHLRVVIWGDPTVPSRQDALLREGTDPTPWLEEGVRHLVDAGADLLVVPCNTVHTFIEPVMAAQRVEFLSIIDVTIKEVQRRRARRVGLLATDGALASGLFQTALDNAAVSYVLPSAARQRFLMELVESVKAGAVDPSLQRQLAELLSGLRGQGATVTIAGCTEISTVVDALPADLAAGVIDPSRELALATIDRASAAAMPQQSVATSSSVRTGVTA